MKKITNIVLTLLIVIAAISVAVWLFGSADSNGKTGPAMVDMMLWVAYAFVGLAVVALIAAAAMNVGKGKGGNTKLNLIVFGGLAVVAVFLWIVFAKDDPVRAADGVTVYENSFTLKATDTGLFLTYFALGITVVALLWGVVRKALK
jgi:hypothetical protein